MAELTLREYQPGDWQAMYALDVQCFAPPFRFSRRAMRRFAEAAGALTLLAEAEGLLAGFSIVQLTPRTAEARTGYVVTLDVAPPHRRTGLARRLMRQMEARAAAAGAQSMSLHVFSANTAAVGLYEALGYERAEIAPDFYGRGFDALVYRKPLAPPLPTA
jgi:[ribosomal protein S18]-alanine N-acetyltransferase